MTIVGKSAIFWLNMKPAPQRAIHAWHSKSGQHSMTRHDIEPTRALLIS